MKTTHKTLPLLAALMGLAFFTSCTTLEAQPHGHRQRMSEQRVMMKVNGAVGRPQRVKIVVTGRNGRGQLMSVWRVQTRSESVYLDLYDGHVIRREPIRPRHAPKMNHGRGKKKGHHAPKMDREHGKKKGHHAPKKHHKGKKHH